VGAIAAADFKPGTPSGNTLLTLAILAGLCCCFAVFLALRWRQRRIKRALDGKMGGMQRGKEGGAIEYAESITPVEGLLAGMQLNPMWAAPGRGRAGRNASTSSPSALVTAPLSSFPREVAGDPRPVPIAAAPPRAQLEATLHEVGALAGSPVNPLSALSRVNIARASSSSAVPLWMEKWSARRQLPYFVSLQTGESTWVLPAGEIAVAMVSNPLAASRVR
jgi:hypothetical protein